jgi:hypothetical protein
MCLLGCKASKFGAGSASAGFLLGFLIDPEDGSDIFLRYITSYYIFTQAGNKFM